MFKGYSREKYPKAEKKLFEQYETETGRNARNKVGDITIGFKRWQRELEIKQEEFFKKHNIESIKHGHYNPTKKKEPELYDLDFNFGIGNPIKIQFESKYRNYFYFVEIKFKK